MNKVLLTSKYIKMVEKQYIETLERRLQKHPHLAQLAGRIGKINYVCLSDYQLSTVERTASTLLNAPLTTEARSFLEDYHNLLNGVKELSREEQYFVHREIKALKAKVRSLQQVNYDTPLNQDRELIHQTMKEYASSSDWFKAKRTGFEPKNDDEPVFYWTLEERTIRKKELGGLLSTGTYCPARILEMFFWGRMMEKLGFKYNSWDFLRCQMHQLDSDKTKYYKSRERDGLRFVKYTVDRNGLPEPTGKGRDYFEEAVKRLCSNNYKCIKRDKIEEIDGRLSVVDEKLLSRKSKIRELKPEIMKMLRLGPYGFWPELSSRSKINIPRMETPWHKKIWKK